MWFGGGSTGVRSGEGAVPPPQKNFGIFSFEMVHFDAFWNLDSGGRLDQL